MPGNDSNTVSLLHMNGASGATATPDTAVGGVHIWTARGNAKAKIDQFKFNESSFYFDGAGDYITTPDSDDFSFGAGDFTVDIWVRPDASAVYKFIIGQYDTDVSGQTSSGSIYKTSANVVYVGFADSGGTLRSIIGTTNIANGAWHHIALVRSGAVITLYVDGVKDGTPYTMGATAMYNNGQTYSIGRTSNNYATYDYSGYMAEARVSKGIARWTATFSPPTQEYNALQIPIGGVYKNIQDNQIVISGALKNINIMKVVSGGAWKDLV